MQIRQQLNEDYERRYVSEQAKLMAFGEIKVDRDIVNKYKNKEENANQSAQAAANADIAQQLEEDRVQNLIGLMTKKSIMLVPEHERYSYAPQDHYRSNNGIDRMI